MLNLVMLSVIMLSVGVLTCELSKTSAAYLLYWMITSVWTNCRNGIAKYNHTCNTQNFRYLWERYPFLELSSIQMSEPNNRPTVRNLIKVKSQTSSLINQRCRLSFIVKCVSLSHAVCGCWSTLSSVLINTRTHTLYLSLSLRYLALFPHLSVSHKSPLHLFDHQLKYRFHRTLLFSFHR